MSKVQDIDSAKDMENPEEKVDENEKEKEEKVTPIPASKLFQYADTTDKIAMTIAGIVAIGQGAAMPLFTVILGDATDTMGSPSTEGETFASRMQDPLIYMVYLTVFTGVAATFQSSIFHKCAERQGARIRVAYLTSALKRDQAWFDVNDCASLPTRMQIEVQKVQDAIGQKFGLILVPFGQLVAGLLVGFIYGWKLTLVILCFFPLMGFSGVLLGSAANDEANQPWYARAGAVAEEVIYSIRTVAAFGGEAREVVRYEGNLTAAMYGAIRCAVKSAAAFGWLMMVFGLSYAVAFWFSAEYLMGPDGDFQGGGDVLLCFFSAIIGVSGVSDASMPMNTFMTGLTAGTNMFKLIDASSTIEHSGEDGSFAESSITEIKFEAVSFAYPSRPLVPVLSSLTVSITKSQKVAFVGESGSGKSTIVQLLERFYDPGEGNIIVNGTNLKDIPVYAWRRRVGYVGQEPVLFATSVLENIRMGVPEATEEACHAAAKQAEALDFLEKLPKKFSTYVGQGGGQMSGGQKQRIAIARALVKQPALLILDEATSALDNTSEKLVQGTLDGLQKQGDLTIISIAHRLSTIRNSDKIFVLSQGKLVESGTHQELVDMKGVYFKLTESQAAADGVGAETDTKETDNPEESAKLIDTDGAVDADGEEKKEKSEEDIEKERLKELEKWNPMSRVLSYADPIVKAWMPIAVLACIVDGGVMPVQGWFLSEAMFDFFLPYECPPPDENPIEQYQCDEYEPKGEKSPLKRESNFNALIFLILAVVHGISIMSKMSIYSWIQERMTKSLRKTYFAAILSQDVGFFDDPANSAGGLTAAVAKQTQLIAGITGISLGQAVGSFCALIIGIVLAFIACWRLALALLGVVPALAAAMALLMKLIMGDEGAEGKGAYKESGAIASESVLNIRTVRACRAEKQVLQNFSEKLQVVVKEKSGESLKSGFAYGFGMAMMFVLYIIVFAYGPYCVDEGFCKSDEMFKALFCLMFGAMGAGMGAIFFQDANKAKLAAYDMFRIVDRNSSIDATNPSGSTSVEKTKPYIQFKEVDFLYPHRPEVQVLKNFSMDIYEGQTVALVGPSGSGKSTIIQLLQRFYDVQTGSLLVGNTELRLLDIKWWRSTMGFVGQEPVLFDTSIEENLKYGKPDATHADVEAAAALANLDFVLNGKIKWEDNVGQKGGKLSGGQKQRVAIARAMLRNPSLLLLDEATSALDSASEKLVQEALDKARKGRTTVVIAHRLSTIQDSDLILVMCDGTVTEQGTHESLLAKQGLYFTLQQKSAA